MASSKYYKQKYKEHKEEAEKLDGKIKELKRIKTSLQNDFYDEVSGANNKRNELKNELKASVRHDRTFTSAADNLSSKKEKNASSDGKLSGAISSINAEIKRMQNKKTEAETKRDQSQRDYNRKKAEEKAKLAK